MNKEERREAHERQITNMQQFFYNLYRLKNESRRDEGSLGVYKFPMEVKTYGIFDGRPAIDRQRNDG